MSTEAKRDPARKRSFNPEDDVAHLLGRWAEKNPNVIEARIINEALRRFLAAYRTKRTPLAKAA